MPSNKSYEELRWEGARIRDARMQGIKTLSKEHHWLTKIENLKPGDACEFRYPARTEWLPGIVVENGGPGYWVVRDESDAEGRWGELAKGLYIEHIRMPGQTEAWPLQMFERKP